VSKSVFKNRPEERIRLKIIEYLIHELGWPGSRIAVEAPLKLDPHSHSKRADIIAYNKDFEPELLIECKADRVLLDEKAGLQISRYNQLVDARYLLISNGLTDHWFEIDSRATKLEDVPYPEQPSDVEKSWDYWQNRGFIGMEPQADHFRQWVIRETDFLYKKQVIPENIHYFNFETAPVDFYLQGYYKVLPYDTRHRFAVGFGSTPEGGNRLNVILNREGENVAILSIMLDLILEGLESNTLMHTESGYTNADFRPLFDEDFKPGIADKIEDLFELILKNT
jgi:hypothetical protein